MRRSSSWLVVLAAIAASGCYSTKVRTPRTDFADESKQQLQMFTLFGFVPLSDPAASECTGGVAFTDSELGATDIAIQLGLTLGGLLGGALGCPEDSAATCASAGAVLAPAAFATRTARYRCLSAAWAPYPGTMPMAPGAVPVPGTPPVPGYPPPGTPGYPPPGTPGYPPHGTPGYPPGYPVVPPGAYPPGAPYAPPAQPQAPVPPPANPRSPRK